MKIILGLIIISLMIFYIIERFLHNPKFLRKHNISLKAIKTYEDICPPFILCPVCLERLEFEWLTPEGNVRSFKEEDMADDIFHCDKCDLDLKGVQNG